VPEVDVEEVEALERARGRRRSMQKCVFACKKKKLISKHQGHREWCRERMEQFETQVDTCVVPEGSEVVTGEAYLP
jgi:hypothetical protein